MPKYKLVNFHMRTDTNKHYISTRWMDGVFETMVFRKVKGRIDWGEIRTHRTTEQRLAVWQHYKEARDIE